MTTPRRVLLPTTVCVLTLAGVLSSCSGPEEGPVAAISDAEARTAVAHVVALAAERSQGAMQQLCADDDGCPGMSSSIAFTPSDAPGPDRAPRELCTVALPPTPWQAGSRVVVLEGSDGGRRSWRRDRSATDPGPG